MNTRLKKLDEASDFDAIILAVAGLRRLGWFERIGEILERDVSLHAVSQGALGIECRADDSRTLAIVGTLTHYHTLLRCTAERAFLRRLEGGCSVPIGVFTEYSPDTKILSLHGGVFSLDGSQQVRGAVAESVEGPEAAKAIGFVFHLLGIFLRSHLF